MHQLYDGLHEVLLKLLKTANTREHVLMYLADLIEKNAGRSQMQVSSLSFPFLCLFDDMFLC
jgi:ubiquitin conjugation factor E4 B